MFLLHFPEALLLVVQHRSNFLLFISSLGWNRFQKSQSLVISSDYLEIFALMFACFHRTIYSWVVWLIQKELCQGFTLSDPRY